MPVYTMQELQNMTFDEISRHRNGVSRKDLLQALGAQAPDNNLNGISWAINNVICTRNAEITRVARGYYQLSEYAEEVADAVQEGVEAETPTAEVVTEQDFYNSFAAWLVDNDEATFAEKLGGNALGGRWGTPDVIGVLRPRATDIFRFQPQIVTAEIKVVSNQSVIAFGQAAAYRLFSHKSYIVIPRHTSPDDLSRLISLCTLHGVGLVTFTLNREAPDYTVVVMAKTAEPDIFFVNSMIDRLRNSDQPFVDRLFG